VATVRSQLSEVRLAPFGGFMHDFVAVPGASLEDPSGLFNSSLGGKVRRAIDIHEGEDLEEVAFKDLVREAVALNAEAKKRSS